MSFECVFDPFDFVLNRLNTVVALASNLDYSKTH